MKMIEVPLSTSERMTVEELLDLLGSQDRRGLVEDEDVRLPVQRLEDLDALPDADRQVLDDRVRIDLAARARSEISTIRARAASRSSEPTGPFVSTRPRA